MTRLYSNHAVLRVLICAVVALLTAESPVEFSAAQTFSASANCRRAQPAQNSDASTASPDPSNLGALSASVDVEVKRQVNADMQRDLVDPGLTPLRITTPNVNGEDETQLESQGRPDVGRTRYSAFAAVPLSTSNWNTAASQDPPKLKGPTAVLQVRTHGGSIRGSDGVAHTDNASSVPALILGGQRSLGQARFQRSNLTGLSKARHRQASYGRKCNKSCLSGLECRAKLKQPRVPSSRQGPKRYSRDFLSSIR